MAQLVLTTAGQMIAGPSGGFLGAMIGRYLDRKVLFPERDTQREGPRLESVNVQTASYGVGIPRLYGTDKFAGNVLWAGDVGFDEERDSTTMSFAVGICPGPIDAIIKIWANDILIQDLVIEGVTVEWGPGARPVVIVNGVPIYSEMRVYFGTETQEPDPRMLELEAERGNVTPAYRGLAYVFFRDWALAYTGQAIPNFIFEVSNSFLSSVPYTPIAITPELPAGTMRAFCGFELGEQEWIDSDEDTYGGEPDSVLRMYGQDSGDDSDNVHSGDYSLVCETYRYGEAWAEVNAPLNCTAESGDDGNDRGGRVQWDERHLQNSWVSVYFKLADVPYPGAGAYTINFMRGRCVRDGSASIYTTWGVDLVVSGSESDGTIKLASEVGLGDGVGDTELEIGTWYFAQVYSRYDSDDDEVRVQLYVASETNDYSDRAIEFDTTYTPNSQYQRYVSRVRLGLRPYQTMPDSGDRILAYFDDLVFAATNVIQYPSQDGDAGYGVPFEYGIARLPPTGAGAHQDWDGTYEDIDEAPADENDYISTSSGQDDTSTFTIEELPDISRILALKVSAAAYGDDEENFRLCSISKDTTDQTPATALRDIADRLDQVDVIYPTDFGRSNQRWEHGAVEDLEIGVASLDDPVGSNTVIQLSACVLYVPKGVRALQGDNLVLHAGGGFVTITDLGNWYRYSLYDNEVILERSYHYLYEQKIPIVGSDFDMDENDVIYTTYWKTTTTNEAYLQKLDAETLSDGMQSTWTLEGPTRVRVCRNSEAPWLVVLGSREGTEGRYVYLVDRQTLTWPPSDYQRKNVTSDYQVVSMDIDDDTGRIWLLANGYQGDALGKSRVAALEPDPEITTALMWDDISNEVEGDGQEIMWCADLESVIVGCPATDSADPHLEYYSQSIASGDLTLTHTQTSSGTVIPEKAKSAWRRGPINGHHMYYAYGSGSKLYHLNLSSGEIEDIYTCEAAEGDDYPPRWLGGNIYEPDGHSVITGCDLADAKYVRVWLDRGEAEGVTLASIVEDICDQIGIEAPELDTSELTDTVYGYLLDNRMRARAALQPLMDAYFFDVIESDGKLKFPKRGGAAIVAIPEAHLAAHVSGENRPQELVTTRQQDLEIPNAVEVVYCAHENNYEIMPQRASRQVTQSLEVRAIDCPIALSDTEAAQIADKWLAYAWMQRNTHTFQVPRQYAYLDPADVVTVTEGGVTHRVRIDKIGYRGGVLAIEATNDAVSVYESTSTGTGAEGEDQDEDPVGPTRLELLDIGLLLASHDQAGLYLAAMGYSDSWIGARVYYSTDAGQSYTEWCTTTNEGVIGYSTDALADTGDPWIIDRGGSVNVRLRKSTDSLSACSEEDFLKVGNLAILGDEIIQFRDVTEEGDGTYTLSHLRRGRYGTEWATDDHEAGDRFALLTYSLFELPEATIVFRSLPPTLFEEELKIKAVSINALTDEGLVQDYTVEFRNLMALSPQQVKGTRDGSNNLTVTCARRVRKYGEWQDGADVPLDQPGEWYRFRFYLAGEVVRTKIPFSPTTTYTAAEQTEDGITPGDPITLTVEQASAVVGYGYATTATV